jgi:hypothetical protein
MFNSKSLTLFHCWDLESPRVSARNRLFGLEPIGIGSPRTESFTSYIARQARAHSVTTGALFSYELAPRSDKPYLLRKSRKGQSVLTTTFYAGTPSLNGLGATARDWTRILESLNGRRDLRYLTMLTWNDALTEKSLSRSVRAWCCECLEERKLSDLEPYECLLWMHKIVKVCPFHKRTLETICSSCRRDMRPLGDRSVPGFCARCCSWLGSSGGKNDHISRADESELEYQVWVASQIGELIAKAPTLSADPTKDMVRESLLAFIDSAAGGNRPGFAREFDLNRNTVQSWGGQRPVPQTDLVHG